MGSDGLDPSGFFYAGASEPRLVLLWRDDVEGGIEGVGDRREGVEHAEVALGGQAQLLDEAARASPDWSNTPASAAFGPVTVSWALST